MMQNRLRFLLLLLMTAVLAFSCASSADAVSDADESIPEVEVEVSATGETDSSESGSAGQVLSEEEVFPALEPASESFLPIDEQQYDADSLEDVAEQDNFSMLNPEDTLPEQENGLVEENAPALIDFENDSFSTEDSAEDQISENLEDEFIPVDDEIAYVLDVSSYYDDFYISDEDFVVIPEIRPEEPAFIEDSALELAADAQSDQASIPARPVYDNEVPELAAEPVIDMPVTDVMPVMKPVSVPPVREDMKKPVVLVTEDEAAKVNEQEKESALQELENILNEIPEPEEPVKPDASRSVIIHKNDILEVPYQGNWWVYLGDENNSGSLVFSGRDYISEKTVFTLRAVKEGESLLHFFKQDIIGGVMVDDYLDVIVEEAGDVSEKVQLDMFIISQIKPVSQESYTDEAVNVGNDVSIESRVPENLTDVVNVPVSSSSEGTAVTDSVSYVQLFEEPSVNSDGAESVSSSDGFETEETVLLNNATASISAPLTDAEIFAQAQALEATDIEGALELYKKLIAEYPASSYWSQANKRVTYINRFYFFKR